MQIKYVHLNLWQGGKIFDKMLSFLKEQQQADIIALQEVYNGTESLWERNFRSFTILEKELGMKGVFSPALIDTRPFGNVPSGNAIFSTYPILSHETIFFDVPFGEFNEETETDWSAWPAIAQHVTLDCNGKTLNVFNVHGPWDTHGGDSARRFTMSEKIITAIKDKKHVILSGDFNVRPNTEAIKKIETYMRNVFKDELQTTFNMQHKKDGGYATSVVDMLFVSKDITVKDHFCPSVDVSDHLPLVATLAI